jgi:hypothetical protein
MDSSLIAVDKLFLKRQQMVSLLVVQTLAALEL